MKQHIHTSLNRSGTHLSLGFQVRVPEIVADQIVPNKRAIQKTEPLKRAKTAVRRSTSSRLTSSQPSSSRWLFTSRHAECDGCDDWDRRVA